VLLRRRSYSRRRFGAQPGVYAVLLGSGVSTGAAMPTAWGVVQELLRRVAAASNPGDADAAECAAADPEEWWQAHADGQALKYSGLFGALAPPRRAGRVSSPPFSSPRTTTARPETRSPATDAHHALAAELVTPEHDRQSYA